MHICTNIDIEEEEGGGKRKEENYGFLEKRRERK
jgi:hypothetical protein